MAKTVDPMSPQAVDARLRNAERTGDDHEQRLADQLDRVKKVESRVGDLARNVMGNINAVKELNALVAKLAETPHTQCDDPDAEDEKEPEPSWFTVSDAERARRMLDDLDEFVDRVYRHYLKLDSQQEQTKLNRCWKWHPAAVEQLLNLRAAWIVAHEGERAGPQAVADWDDRYMPGTARRLGSLLGACSIEHHTPARSVMEMDENGEIAEVWARTHDEKALPMPTVGMVKLHREQTAREY